jgi:hypothetical protein
LFHISDFLLRIINSYYSVELVIILSILITVFHWLLCIIDSYDSVAMLANINFEFYDRIPFFSAAALSEASFASFLILILLSVASFLILTLSCLAEIAMSSLDTTFSALFSGILHIHNMDVGDISNMVWGMEWGNAFLQGARVVGAVVCTGMACITVSCTGMACTTVSCTGMACTALTKFTFRGS